ncbi:MAG: hypothetical protein QOJ15_8484 [Bradyrhizobium sp.]|jgi:putative SOS response-associated peptidase YedK|nr:hypothetical protein [Bradyrhizobium sp.]
MAQVWSLSIAATSGPWSVCYGAFRPGPREDGSSTSVIRSSSLGSPLIENKARRCVVPATSFAESGRDTGSLTRLQWFARHNRKPFMFAGVWTKWRGDRGTNGAPNVGEHRLYSIMTTEANAVVQPVDDVMPVILTTVAEVEQWLTGSVEEALALQRPAADDVIKLLADEKKAA